MSAAAESYSVLSFVLWGVRMENLVKISPAMQFERNKQVNEQNRNASDGNFLKFFNWKFSTERSWRRDLFISFVS